MLNRPEGPETLISFIKSASDAECPSLVEKIAANHSDSKECRPVGFALNIGLACKG
jgi:hypothetical protein